MRPEREYNKGKSDGIREVVEWIIKEQDIPVRYAHNATCYDCIERLKQKYIVLPIKIKEDKIWLNIGAKNIKCLSLRRAR